MILFMIQLYTFLSTERLITCGEIGKNKSKDIVLSLLFIIICEQYSILPQRVFKESLVGSKILIYKTKLLNFSVNN